VATGEAPRFYTVLCHSDPERSEGEESRACIPFTPCHPSASLRASPLDYAQGKLVEGIARPEICVAGILLNFGSLTGVSGSASAERRLQPQKGYNPSPGSFTHFFYFCPATEFWPGYRAFSQLRRKTTVLPHRRLLTDGR